MNLLLTLVVLYAVLYVLQRLAARRTLPCYDEPRPSHVDPAMPDDVLVAQVGDLALAATPAEPVEAGDLCDVVPSARAAVVAATALRLALQARRPGRFTAVGLPRTGGWSPWLLPDADPTSSFISDRRTVEGYAACRIALHRDRRQKDRWASRPPSFWATMFLNTLAAVEPDDDARRAVLRAAAARPAWRVFLDR